MIKTEYIDFEKGKEISKVISEAYKSYYKDAPNFLRKEKKKAKSAGNIFLKQLQDDSRNYLDGIGFSSGFIYKLFYEEDSSKRNFNPDLLENVLALIVYYQDNNYGGNEDDISSNNTKVRTITLSEISSKASRGNQGKGTELGNPTKKTWYSKFKNWYSEHSWRNKIIAPSLLIIISIVMFITWSIFFPPHKPIFEVDNPYYKILILPFENDCRMASTLDTADKNAVLKRLRELNSRDSLGLDIRFHENYIPEEMKAGQSNYDYYNEIIEKNNADHIIFGSILSAECSNSGKDELALSYHINQRNNINNQESIFKYTLYHSPVSFSEILKGRQLEDIEYTVYLNIALSFFNQHKFHHADYYMRYLLSNAERFNDEDIFNIKLIRFFIFNFYYTNNPSGVEEQKLNDNILDYCSQFFEYRNKEYYTYEIDLYCRFSLDLIETGSVSQELQAEIEQRIESNDLNADTLFVYKLFFLLVDIEDYLYKNDVHDIEKIDQVYALIDKYMNEFSESIHGLLLLEYFLRAFAELEFPSSEKLIDYINIILKEKPNQYDFLTIRAGLYREINEYDKALKDFTLLHERHPDSLDVNFEIINTYLEMEDDNQAHQMAMKTLTRLSESQDARYYLFFDVEPLIDYFFERKQYRYAIDLIDTIVKNSNLNHITKHKLVEKGFEANVHGKNYREILYYEAKLFELNLIITNKIYGPENDSETLDFEYLGPDIQNPNIDTSGLLEIK